MSREEALSRMTALCSTAEHCESDVRERLQRAALVDADIDSIIDYLYKENYLNTARYCTAFSRDKLRFARWGRIKIGQALRQRRLPQQDIDNALDALPEDEYEEICEGVMAQKARTLRSGEDTYTRRNKLLRFALGRGFTMDEALRAMPSHLQEDDY